MDALLLARIQFALTTLYHFLFVPLTLGLSVLVALMETLWVRTGDETYRRMTKFWGKLFLLNFAMGVVTGIVQEFQFGMNWAEYSRFVGDVFGGPLAIEALMAFFVESTFLGVWIFGWEKVSKRVHLAAIWLVAFASNVSAFWILVANSFMQQPVGFELRNGRAEMTDFFALVASPHVWLQYPHVLASGVATAAFIVVGISAFHLARATPDRPAFARSLKWGVLFGAAGALAVAGVGHAQTQHVFRVQPMKMAAAEALWRTESPASFSIFTVGDQENLRDRFSLRVPSVLTLLAYNSFEGEVKGIVDLQEEYEARYGPGDYVPPVVVTYWSFRIMVGAGGLMILLMFWGLYRLYRRDLAGPSRFLKYAPWGIALPFAANAAGWVLTEVGRWPWIVFGLQRTAEGASLSVTGWMVAVSLVAFVGIYTALLFPYVFLVRRFGFAAAS
jgi:cytochrome d ubiquinol oxidase subunit I